MATLYQLHSSMDTLRRSTNELALTWRAGDSILLLGTTVAFIDWLDAYLGDGDIKGITAIYALADDVAQLSSNTTAKLNLNAKLTGILTDDEWVTLTQNAQFDKVVTIAL
jgi:tRNA 2-thiouridine synthesizing protein B